MNHETKLKNEESHVNGMLTQEDVDSAVRAAMSVEASSLHTRGRLWGWVAVAMAVLIGFILLIWLI